MLLYIIIALFFLLAGIVRASKNKNDMRQWSLTMTAAISLAVSTLSYPYYMAKYNDHILSFLSAIRYGPSVISMKVENDLLSVLALQEPIATVYKFLIYDLYLAAPITGSIVIISFSRMLTEWLKGLFAKNIHIFAELNEKTISIAESIFAEGKKCRLVFCNAKEIKNDSLKTIALRIGAVIIDKKETQIPLRKKCNYEFYEINENTSNLDRISDLCASLLKNKNYLQKNVVVRCVMNDNAREYIRKLDQMYGDKVYLRYINEDNATAIELLRKIKDNSVRIKHHEIVIVGLSGVANSLLKNIICLMLEPESTCIIHIIDPKAEKMLSKMKLESPELINADMSLYLDNNSHVEKNYDLRFHKKDIDSWEMIEVLREIKSPQIICLCSKDDKLNFDMSQHIKRYYASQSGEMKYPAIAALIRNPEINRLVKNDNDILYFGNYENSYTYNRVINPELEDVAKRTHLAYLSGIYGNIIKKPQEETEKVLQETGYYNYNNIEASLAEGLTLEYRYAYILSKKNDNSISDTEFVRNWLNDKDNLKIIGDAEHIRWNAYQRITGWRRASEAQMDEMARLSNGKRVKNNEMLLHTAMVEVEELPETEKKADETLQKYNPDRTPTRYVELDRDIYQYMIDILDE